MYSTQLFPEIMHMIVWYAPSSVFSQPSRVSCYRTQEIVYYGKGIMYYRPCGL